MSEEKVRPNQKIRASPIQTDGPGWTVQPSMVRVIQNCCDCDLVRSEGYSQSWSDIGNATRLVH